MTDLHDKEKGRKFQPMQLPEIPREISGVRKDGKKDKRFKKGTTMEELKDYMEQASGQSPPTEEKTMADLRKWVYKELEPYFQGEFGTMDTMLEMFIEQLTDKLSDLFTEEYLKGFKEGSDLKNFPQLIDTDKIYEKAYDDCAKRFRMREKTLKDSFRRKLEEAIGEEEDVMKIKK